jgi:hypothetical protein
LQKRSQQLQAKREQADAAARAERERALERERSLLARPAASLKPILVVHKDKDAKAKESS